jgi:hypothetical protein
VLEASTAETKGLVEMRVPGSRDGSSAKAGGVAWLISSSGEIAIRQERAKRFDFRRHEIGESPWVPLRPLSHAAR